MATSVAARSSSWTHNWFTNCRPTANDYYEIIKSIEAYLHHHSKTCGGQAQREYEETHPVCIALTERSYTVLSQKMLPPYQQSTRMCQGPG